MPKSLQVEWGERLTAERTSAGLTQAALAAEVHVTRGHIWNLENGVSSPGDDLRLRLARTLNTTVAELFPYPDSAVA